MSIRSGGCLRPPPSVCGCPDLGRRPGCPKGCDGDGVTSSAARRAAPVGGVRRDGGAGGVAGAYRRVGGRWRDAVPPQHRGSGAGGGAGGVAPGRRAAGGAAAGFDRSGGRGGPAGARARHGLAADAGGRRGRRRRANDGGRAGARRGAGGARRRVGLRAGSRRAYQSSEPGDRQPCVRDHPRGGLGAGAGVLAGAARRGAGRLWQALPRSRRHPHRFAPRAAGRAARSRAVAPGGAGAVRRRRRRRDGGVHDGARSLSGARSRSAGDAVAPDRDRAAARWSSGFAASWSPTISG